jgi:aminoglycoside/choline kinase family phosphotransferase
MTRLEALAHWLEKNCNIAGSSLMPASSDASFRRYFRISQGKRSYIVMDAPPELEDCTSFIAIATVLRSAGLRAPEIFAQDLTLGFLLLEDLGAQTYLDALQCQDADPLYRRALSALCTLQEISVESSHNIPLYDGQKLQTEMDLCPTWYFNQHLGRPFNQESQEIWKQASAAIIQNCLAQGQVLVHRDYHSRNLMACEPGPGILDFQDAVIGPITYDLVSLLRDAYIEFDEEQQLDWLVRWWEQARKMGLHVPDDMGECYRNFEWMGVQRHLKILGIFARLHHRDGKSSYLDSIPRVLSYTQKACERYIELRPLSRLLADSHDQLSEGLSF